MGYLKNTIKGVSWMGALRGITRIISIVRIGILARLLSPVQFGVFGIASLVLAFLEIVTETGINIFLIQENKKLEEYLDTAWIVSILRGILIGVVIIVIAPLITTFFKSPDSLILIYLISFVPFIRGFINPVEVKFQKNLEFHKEFYFRLVIFSVDSIIAIIVTFITKSAIGMIWGLIAGSSIEVFIKPRPRFKLNFLQMKKVINRGKWIAGFGLLNYLFEHGDDLVIGKLLNIGSLGIYQVGYKISTLPISEIADVFYKVTFPVYTKIVDDKKRLKKAYLKTMAVISILVISLSLVIFIFAKLIVTIVLGSGWGDVIPVIRILAIFGMIKAIVSSGYTLFLADKKQEYVTFCILAGTLGLALTIVPLVSKYGIMGAGYSAIIGTVMTIPFYFYYLSLTFKNIN
jgi:O-antigen/teichoic acid export membrane protein